MSLSRSEWIAIGAAIATVLGVFIAAFAIVVALVSSINSQSATLRTEIQAVRTDLRVEIGELREELGEIREELDEGQDRLGNRLSEVELGQARLEGANGALSEVLKQQSHTHEARVN